MSNRNVRILTALSFAVLWLAGVVPSARFERALYGPSDRCLLPLGYEGERPAGDEPAGRSALDEGGPRRSLRGGPQRHPRLGRRPVALALVAAATGGRRVEP